MGERTAILVLGMHRSGTSAITRVINLLGAALPGNLMPPSPQQNETGFWESLEIVAAHDRFLQEVGSSWHDPRPLARSAMMGDAARVCKEALLAILRRDFAHESLFVIKDPRLCRLVPLWLDILAGEGIRPVVVLMVRNPLEVADSLFRRNGFSRNWSLTMWLVYLLSAEAATRQLPRITLFYENVLADPQQVAHRLRHELDCFDPAKMALPEIMDFLSQRYRHHHHQNHEVVEDTTLPVWVRQCYASLINMDGEKGRELAQLVTIGGELGRAMELLSELISSELSEGFSWLEARLDEKNLALHHSEAALAEQSRQREALAAALQQSEQLRGEEEQRHALEREHLQAEMAEEKRQHRAVLEEERHHHLQEKQLLQTTLESLQQRYDRLFQQGVRQRQQVFSRLDVLLTRVVTWCHMPMFLMKGFWDRGWYRGQLTGISKKLPLLWLHYLLWGYWRDLSPHSLMDVATYRQQNDDVVMSGLDVVGHFARFGWREGRNPSLWFDTSFYLAANAEVARSGIHPLLHYIRRGWREGCNPTPWFDSHYYLQNNPDVAS
ncbi:MAG: hypothetical protein G8345_17355, partial [Magnetococcales bacterium]|nr:hypothetical protein [Magnetococcales bacterium]